MNTSQVRDLLNIHPFTKDILQGVIPRSGLPQRITKYPAAFVCNTDSSDDPGEHWVAIYVTEHCGEYFDSFGKPPSHVEFRLFLEENCAVYTHNDQQLQSVDSIMCGFYCVMFILAKCDGMTMDTLLKGFGSNLIANDFILRDRLLEWYKYVTTSPSKSIQVEPVTHHFTLATAPVESTPLSAPHGTSLSHTASVKSTVLSEQHTQQPPSTLPPLPTSTTSRTTRRRWIARRYSTPTAPRPPTV